MRSQVLLYDGVGFDPSTIAVYRKSAFPATAASTAFVRNTRFCILRGLRGCRRPPGVPQTALGGPGGVHGALVEVHEA